MFLYTRTLLLGSFTKSCAVCDGLFDFGDLRADLFDFGDLRADLLGFGAAGLLFGLDFELLTGDECI